MGAVRSPTALSWVTSRAHFAFEWLREEPDWLQVALPWLQEAPPWLQVAPQGPPDTPGMAPVTGYISRLNTKFSIVRKYGYLVETNYGQKVLNPEMGQKVRFWKEDGHEMDKVLAVRHENGSTHTNFFMRVQP